MLNQIYLVRDYDAGLYRRQTPFTQCLSSVGVAKPSPLNTCPKWEPQLLQTISILRPSASGISLIAFGIPV